MSTGASGTAWALLVVSDPQQADTLADQELWAKEAALTHGWTITKTFSGVSSGKDGVRKLTAQMITDLNALPAQQRPDRLLMIRLERLGRGNGLEAMEAFLQIRRLNITVHTRLDGDVNYNRASELLMPVLRFFIGGMENEVRRDKLISLYARRRELREADPSVAVSMRPAYGLQYVAGRLLPKPPEDAAVRLAYELKTQGYASYTIAKRLARVAPPATLKDGTERPQHWNATRVTRLLAKSSYRDVLVDEETWLRAQGAIGVYHRPTRKYEYPFGGSLRCECGYRLIGQKGTGKASSTFRYYQCRNRAGHDGHYKHYRSDLIEQQFVDLLNVLAVEDELIQAYLSHQQPLVDREGLEAQMRSHRAELAAIEDRKRLLFSAYEDGALCREDLQWRLDDLKTRVAQLEQELSEMEREDGTACAVAINAESIRTLVSKARKLWPSATGEDKRALAKMIGKSFGQLIIKNDGALILGCVQTNGVAVAGKSGVVVHVQT